MTAPRFSPPSSEVGDRATSPALSSSSRTTTSIPTDVSDISSLDGSEYEVIDGPVYSQDEDEDGPTDASDSSRFPHHDTSIGSEIDGSSFLAPSHQINEQQEDSDEHWQGSNERLHASTSLTTLHLEPGVVDSQGSSLLRFPDPLHESFQEGRPFVFSSKDFGHNDGDDEHSSVPLFPPGEAMTPRMVQSEAKFALPASSSSKKDKQMTGDDNQGHEKPNPGPVGIPFLWNKKMILTNVFRAVMGLIIIIISTGVLPVWPGSTAISSQGVQDCHGMSFSKLDTIFGKSPACSTRTPASKQPSKALIVQPRSNVSVFSSVTKLVTRPTNKVVDVFTRTKEVSIVRQSCQSLSLYSAEIRSSHRVVTSRPSNSIQNADKVSQVGWTSAKCRGKVAADNAKIMTAYFRKDWSTWVQEMNEGIYSTVFTLVDAVRQVSLLQKKANQDNWTRFWNYSTRMMAFILSSWSDMMGDIHNMFAQFYRLFQDDTFTFTKDAEAHYRSIRVALEQQYKQAVMGSHRVQKIVKKGSQDAQRSLKKGAQDAQNSLNMAWEGVRGSEKIQQLQRDMSATTKHVAQRIAKKKASIRAAASNRKRLRAMRAAKKRMEEIKVLAAKHRKMMELVREQNNLSSKADRWIRSGKVALYQKAFQSAMVKHQVENWLEKATNGKSKGSGKRYSKGKKGKPAHKGRKASARTR